MKTDSDFSKKLGTDIFGLYDDIIQTDKLFIKLFNDFFEAIEIENRKINIEKLYKKLTEKYPLGKKYNFKRYEVKDDNPNKAFCIKAIIVLKHSLCLFFDKDNICLYYGKRIKSDEVKEIIKIFKKCTIKENHEKKFYMIAVHHGWYLEEFKVIPNNIDINENYNDDFKNTHEVILNSLKRENKSGIILLHGDYGAGKTSYIRHLINSTDKKFIYVPLSLLNDLSSPSFIPFIRKHKNSVLILEDCENYIANRQSRNSRENALSNLLNITDGLLSDALSIKVICTFNTNLSNIDKALLRKGRLIARYEFRELEINKAQNILNKSGKDVIIDKPLTLAEIYNLDSITFGTNGNKKIGFAVS